MEWRVEDTRKRLVVALLPLLEDYLAERGRWAGPNTAPRDIGPLELRDLGASVGEEAVEELAKARRIACSWETSWWR